MTLFGSPSSRNIPALALWAYTSPSETGTICNLGVKKQVTAMAKSSFPYVQLVHQFCPFLNQEALQTITWALITSNGLIVLHTTWDCP